MPRQAASRFRGVFSRRMCSIIVLAWAAVAGRAAAQNIDEMVRPLAARIPEWLPARTAVSVQCVNRSQAKDADFAPVCRAFSREVQRQGFPLGAHDLPITFTASENANGRLLIAQADSNSGPKVAMTNWAAAATQPPAAGVVRIERTILLESPNPALDFAVMRDGAAIAVLEPAAVALYSRTAAGWELLRRELLPLARPAPRDLRGRLIANGSGVAAYLPGSACVSEELAARPFSCTQEESRWSVAPGVSVRWAVNRNYLESDAGAAYTVGPIAADRLIATSLDGTLRLAGVHGEAVAALSGYGSDAAVVEQACGAFVIATRGGDAAEGDRLIPVDARNDRLENAGAALPVPGPVTAVWPSEVRTEAHAVVRNAGTGAYELSRVTVQCGQ